MAAADRADRPGAQQWVPERGDVADLRDAAPACRGCELWAPATQVVFSSGSSHARLMMVGEQPGDKEDLQGEPFVGPAGSLLRRALEAAGIELGDVLLGPDVRVTKQRGQLLTQETQLGARLFVPTVHPSSILRGPSSARQETYDAFVADLQTAGKVLSR